METNIFIYKSHFVKMRKKAFKTVLVLKIKPDLWQNVFSNLELK